MTVSFDFWGTLVKKSPLFSQRKVDLFINYFPKRELKDCVSAWDEARYILSEAVDITGWQPSVEEVWSAFLYCLGEKLSYTDLRNIKEDYKLLSLLYAPKIIDEVNLRENLSSLISKGHSPIIVSDSLFIRNTRDILQKLNLLQYFTEIVLSHEIDKSKILYNIKDVKYHIGDSERDEIFSEKNKITFLKVTEKETVSNHVRNILSGI